MNAVSAPIYQGHSQRAAGKIYLGNCKEDHTPPNPAGEEKKTVVIKDDVIVTTASPYRLS